MFLKNYLIFGVSLVLMNSCNVSKVTTPKTSEGGDLILSYARGACFGRCPVYEISTFEDGSFVFEAKRFMDEIGVSEGNWNDQKWKEIRTALDKLDWEGYQEYYDSNIPDLPSTTIRWRGKEVSFKESVPQELEEITAQMHEMILEMDKGQMVYRAEEDHMSTKDLVLTLNDGCTLDRDFQLQWKEFIAEITPLTEEVGQYRIKLKPYSIDTGEAYARLKGNACISNVQIQ